MGELGLGDGILHLTSEAYDPLPLLPFLDPRPREHAESDPYRDAVNIPSAELLDRVFELPPKCEPITVIGPDDDCEKAVHILSTTKRKALFGPPAQGATEHGRGRLWRPNAFLERQRPSLKPGSALDLACGVGRDAVFLAAHGWGVHGIDILEDALDRARALAGRYLRSDPAPVFRSHDLRSPVIEEPYDLVCCFFYFEPSLLAALPGLLAPGGTFLFEHFTEAHRRAMGKPRRPVERDRLTTLLQGLEIVCIEESSEGGRSTLRLRAMQRD